MNEIYQYYNTVFLSGRISKLRPGKNKLSVVLSCGQSDSRKPRRLANGMFYRDVVTVVFFDMDADYYAQEFVVGDFVTVNALAQNVTDRTDGMRHLEVWGLNMLKRPAKGHDRNDVMLRGKIAESKVISDDYILLLVHTATEATRPNHREGTEVPLITDSYHSDTPVGIRLKGTAKKEIVRYTPGTWVKLSGFVYGQKVRDVHVERVIAREIDVVGMVQRVFP
jgi:hypothetical protein